MDICVLIPAYNPAQDLIKLVENLVLTEVGKVVIVNDGSKPSSQSIFAQIKTMDNVIVLSHAVNLGKGAALRTGLNYIYCELEGYTGVVTADADGQHAVEDIIKVAKRLHETEDALILGAREFSNDKVPFKSKVGNLTTKVLFRSLMGKKIADTQTGLRGIPKNLIPDLLKLFANGYEFELDMIIFCSQNGWRIEEIPIRTIYIDNNKSSHFNPITDSLKIYFVLFRFVIASVLTAGLDYFVFILSFSFGQNLLVSQSLSRGIALVFNYFLVRNKVFYCYDKHAKLFGKYVLLVIFMGTVSYGLINYFTHTFGINVIYAKIISELIVYIANFAIQRQFIFVNSKQDLCTDWDAYYSKPYKTATITRKITENLLIDLMKKYTSDEGKLRLTELGGANSCFFERVRADIKPAEYHIVDNNELGLIKFKERIQNTDGVFLYPDDVLNLQRKLQHDLVFSVGLVEHFDQTNTQRAILAHLELLKPGGIAIISFPTPTLLYWSARFFAELFGLWIFHDERPIGRDEFISVIEGNGEILYEKIIWPIVFTQRIFVVRKI